MPSDRSLSGRVNGWIENRSRGGYAVLTGVLTGGGVFVAGLVIGGDRLFVDAVLMALTMTAVYYALDPRNWAG
ncbi:MULTISPECIES: hypothetical protein [Halomicrobium]|uniref:Uncharacterized protein n=2 Tax=Halomicrobium mukohataei TaxID=57705 RepID=C7NZR4_HALMD|nr:MULTISPECIES: hypothetical protein [Halomicrobium]ACV48832.1 hypothetical protein Hmuk_2726 [Halomicrobium mukohataei DSM 12286]QCD64264.1 hypothetical protein E5139_00935 [Halomicrobium mukohataei]QFR19070.1 hypothetical protein GBQ70_00935 [Halomicrobium sp. ZPS1]